MILVLVLTVTTTDLRNTEELKAEIFNKAQETVASIVSTHEACLSRRHPEIIADPKSVFEHPGSTTLLVDRAQQGK